MKLQLLFDQALFIKQYNKNHHMEIIKKYFTDFTETQWQQFAALKNLYVEWNQQINVISRKDMDNFYEHTYCTHWRLPRSFNLRLACR